MAPGKNSSEGIRGFVERPLGKATTAAAAALAMMGLAGCENNASAAPSPTTSVEQTAAPSPEVPAETPEQLHDRYVQEFTIPAGLSTEELGQAICNNFEKWDNITLVEGDLRADRDATLDLDADEWADKITVPYSDAAKEAFIGESITGGDDLKRLVDSRRVNSHENAVRNGIGDFYDAERYQTFYDCTDVIENTSTSQEGGATYRVVELDVDVWDNSDKNYIPDNPDKGTNVHRYAITVDETSGSSMVVAFEDIT